jgi:hypothetical protein
VLIVGWPKVDLKVIDSLAARHGLGMTSLRGTFLVGHGGMIKIKGKWKPVNDPAAYLAKVFGNYLSKVADEDLWQQYVDCMPAGYRQLTHGGGWPGTLLRLREERRAKITPSLAWVNRMIVIDRLRDRLGAVPVNGWWGFPCGVRDSTVDSDLPSLGIQDPLFVM